MIDCSKRVQLQSENVSRSIAANVSACNVQNVPGLTVANVSTYKANVCHEMMQ